MKHILIPFNYFFAKLSKSVSGLAVISMTINLLQEEVIDMVINLAKDLGIIDDDDDEDDDD